MYVEYLTQLQLTPVARDQPAKHLDKKTNKMMLVDDFIIRVNEQNGDQIIIKVPKGYITDGASIPKFFHRLWTPFNTESFWASVVHDRIYSHLHYKFSKEFADNLFKEMIRRDGGGVIMRNAFYNAVRLNINGGGWNE